MIPPVICHLWGPLSIQSYGLFIALGVTIGITLLQSDQLFTKLMSVDQFQTLFLATLGAALLGGRTLSLLEGSITLTEFLYFWQPGYSILGSVIAGMVTIITLLYYYQLNPVQVLDRIALYIPLIQAIARLGCFFAGCCYGKETSVLWAISYTDSRSLAPLHTFLHPTQLYSSLLLFILFIALYYFKNSFKKPGTILSLYLLGIGFERFIIDFFRADHKLVIWYFSPTQILAATIFIIGLCLQGGTSYAQRERKSL